MIIVCSSCSAQYSVPDARVRGKLVRITCKHCSKGIVFDARDMPAEGESALHSALARLPPTGQVAQKSGAEGAPEEDVTMIARPKFGQDVSANDERTVIGQIAPELLESERLFAQRTQPPPSEREPSAPPLVRASLPVRQSERPSALPEQPERAADETKAASPQAFALAEPAEPPPQAPALAKPKPKRDEPTLISQGNSHEPPARTAKARHVRLALLVLFATFALALWLVNQRRH